MNSPRASHSSSLSQTTALLSRRLIISFSLTSLSLLAISIPLFLSSTAPPAFPSSLYPQTSHSRSSSRHLLAHPQISDPPATREANIAFFVQVSEATANHLPRLLARIYHPRNVYAIHFDKKMQQHLFESIKTSIFAHNRHYSKNVFFMKPQLITYRGVSMLLNTINAMKLLLERSEPWDYFINLSGSDYPLVSPTLQRTLLGNHVQNAFNFITYSQPHRWHQNVHFRMNNFYVDEALSFTQNATVVRQVPAHNPLADHMNFQYANAEAWMINSRHFCHFVVTSAYARKMLLTFAYSVEASEHYFSTLLWNHPLYNRKIVPHAMRHVIWKHEGQHAGQHPFYVDDRRLDGSFTFGSMLDRSSNFFVRKFRSHDSPLMEYIDAHSTDAERVTRVRNHFHWAVAKGLRDRASEPHVSDSEYAE